MKKIELYLAMVFVVCSCGLAGNKSGMTKEQKALYQESLEKVQILERNLSEEALRQFLISTVGMTGDENKDNNQVRKWRRKRS